MNKVYSWKFCGNHGEIHPSFSASLNPDRTARCWTREEAISSAALHRACGNLEGKFYLLEGEQTTLGVLGYKTIGEIRFEITNDEIHAAWGAYLPELYPGVNVPLYGCSAYTQETIDMWADILRKAGRI